MTSWSIVSASGRMRFELSAPTAQVGPAASLCSVKIESDFWQRDRDFTKAAGFRDFDVCLYQVLIDPEAFGVLRNRLAAWLTTAAEFECPLGTHSPSDPGLIVALGKAPDLIYSASKPACTITYKNAPAMAAKWSFVVDQSCVRACIESLDQFIREWV